MPGIRARYRHGARVHDAAARQARHQAGDAGRARRTSRTPASRPSSATGPTTSRTAIRCPDTDVVLFAADSHEALGRLPALRERIVPNGAIWVVSRKGKAATIRDVDVIAAARAGGARGQQGGELRRDADVAAPRDPGRAAARRAEAARRARCYHPRMDIVIVLVIVLILVLVWRGPKTLPSLGKAFGQGVKEARKEIDVGQGRRRPRRTTRPVLTRRRSAVAASLRPPAPEHDVPVLLDSG